MSALTLNSIPQRHRPGFLAWRAAGRLVTADVLDAAKVKDRRTIYNWIDAEGWELVAEDIDAAETAALSDGQRERTAAAEKAKLRFIERGEALISLAQELASEGMIEVMSRYRRGSSVDLGEVKDAVSAMKTVTDAGIQLYGLNKLAVNHSGAVEVRETDLSAIAERLTKAGVIPKDMADAIANQPAANA